MISISNSNQSNDKVGLDELYNSYNSTSVFTPDVSQKSAIQWSKGYFISVYATLIPQDKFSKILEVGCGYGRYVHTLTDMGYVNSFGIDLSAQQIEYARDHLCLSNVEQADALEWLDGKESEYDCILALDLLEHLSISDLLNLGEKIQKALKPGGFAIFQVPNGLSPLNPIIYGDLSHARAFTPQSLKQFMIHVGMQPLKFSEIPPHIYNFKSGLQRVLWTCFVRHAISFFFFLVHGRLIGGQIHTANFVGIGIKAS
jgi:2-polyprenyl-3-methyl-5-hydroxy-6-metoxy-1,4-benzoquinol methylase